MEEKNTDSIKQQREKSGKNIAEGLSKLKSSIDSGKENTLESKMPSRGDEHQGIRIPVPVRFSKDNQPEVITSSGLHGQELVYKKEQIEAARKTLQEQNKRVSQGPANSQDGSILGDGMGISRRDLEAQLRRNPKAWQAERQSGLTLGPSGRAKLLKDVPKFYGTNISKSDLKGTVIELNRKLVSTKDPQQHAQIRKEIKFFKKIGGLG